MSRATALALAVAALAGLLPALLSGADPLADLPAVHGGADPLAQAAHLAHATRTLPGTEAFWQAPWLFPGRWSQLYLDPMVGPSVVARVVPGDDPAFDYHVALWFTVATSVLAMAWCARRFGVGSGFALAAGVVYAVGPYAAGHFHHLNQVPSAWLPLAFGALHATLRGARPWRGVALFVAAVALQASWSVYATAALVFGAVVLAAGLGGVRRRIRPLVAIVLGTGAVLVVAAIPYVLAGRTVEGFGREAAEALAFQARWFDLWKAAEPRLLPWPTHDPLRPSLYLGAGLVVLAGLGLARAFERRTTITLLAVGALGLGLAFGRTFLVPFTDLEIPLPYMLLQDLVWPLRALRDPSRFALLTSWVVALAAAGGGRWIVATRPRLAVVACVLVVLDAAPGAFDRVRVGDDAAVTEALRQLPDDAVWAGWPMACDETQEAARDARFMHWAVVSGRPVAGGASGFVPPAVQRLRSALCARLDASALRAVGVGWVVTDAPVDAPVRWTDGTWSLVAVEDLSAEGDRP